jgi:hypothetical protein
MNTLNLSVGEDECPKKHDIFRSVHSFETGFLTGFSTGLVSKPFLDYYFFGLGHL